MLKRPARSRLRSPENDVRVAVVASEYNRNHVDGLLAGAEGVLRKAGVEVEVFRVPGAFEIPLVAECLASDPARNWAAVICLGVIVRGETSHADLVGEAVTRGLMEVSVRHRLPVVHEVLLLKDLAQADVRCLDPRYNRGVEAARTALAMVRLLARWGAGSRMNTRANKSSN